MTGRARFLLLALVSGIALVWTSEAAAQRVVLVQAGEQDALLIDAWHRLLAELRIHHFESETVQLGDTADLAGALTETARARDAIAAIALVRQNETTAVDVWLIDRVTGKTTLRRILVRPGADAPSVLAIRAVDLLRASLREYEAGERPPADVADVDRRPVPAAVTALSAHPPSTVALSAGAVFLMEPPGFGVAAGPSLGVFARATERAAVGVLLAGPLVGARFSTQGGSASLTQALGVVEARFSILGSRAFQAGPSVAIGAYHLAASGSARAPLTSRDDSAWAVIGGAGAFIQIRLWEHGAVLASARLLGTWPRLGIAVGPDSALLRFPVLETSLALAVDL